MQVNSYSVTKVIADYFAKSEHGALGLISASNWSSALHIGPAGNAMAAPCWTFETVRITGGHGLVVTSYVTNSQTPNRTRIKRFREAWVTAADLSDILAEVDAEMAEALPLKAVC